MKRFKRLHFRLRSLWLGLTMKPIIGAEDDGGDGGEGAGEGADAGGEGKGKAPAETPAGGEGKDAKGGDKGTGEKPPWGSDDDFDAERAWKLIQDTRADKNKIKAERDELSGKVKDHEDASKSEQEKLSERATTAEENAKTATADAARLRVALKKGLTETQAKRLVGEDEEALEKDADELLESFKSEDDDGQEPRRRPREKLRPGAAPGSEPEENDPAKLAEAVPRI